MPNKCVVTHGYPTVGKTEVLETEPCNIRLYTIFFIFREIFKFLQKSIFIWRNVQFAELFFQLL